MEPPPVAGFAMVEFEVTQGAEMVEPHAILESINDKAYVKVNCHFIQQEYVEINALFDELDAEVEVKAEAE
ncbi:putative LRR receptor-like serine/threonine-protein kinase [Hordeum vulgare]|nr:putative LRR receptor-like serine/threonine-protein kinase [Hordeum vulgare]